MKNRIVDIKYILKVLLILFQILSLTVFINLFFGEKGMVESLKTIDATSITMNKNDAFCETHRGSSGNLDNSCGKLTRNNCNSTSCCVWKSDNKCSAGTVKGPTFNTDSNGKTKQLDYYYFQNKCYGDKCPKE